MQRLLWPDITKTVGLYLMILGHGGLYGTETIQQFIYSFHMPLFFILSGMFFKHGNLKKTTITLLVPYFFMNTLMLVWSLFFNNGSIVLWFSKHIPAVLLGLGYNTDNFVPVCTPMWFFYVLYIEHLIMNLIFKISTNKTILLSISLFNVISIVSVVILKKNNIDTLFPIDSVLFAFPFFSIGLLLKQTLLKRWSTSTTLKVILFMTPSLIIANFFNGRIDMNTVIIGNNILLTIVSGTAGTFLLIAISKLIEDKSVFLTKMINWEKYSNGASIIVGLNLLIITILLKLLIYIYPSFELNTIYGLIISFAIMKLCYPLIVFCLKYCPMLIGRKKYTSVKQI